MIIFEAPAARAGRAPRARAVCGVQQLAGLQYLSAATGALYTAVHNAFDPPVPR